MILRFTFIFLLFGALSTGYAQNATGKQGEDVLQLKELSYDFGKIPQGRPVTHDFELVNAGKAPLLIENVQASCGCTSPVWSQAPIAPGASSTVKVGFNAAAEGPFSKTIAVIYNGSQVRELVISGEVYASPKTSAPLNSSLSFIKQLNQ